MKKSTIIESISKLPDEVTIDEIVERLIIIEKIEKGRKEVQAGKVNTEEQAETKLKKWLG
jgi:predicted transcriptional regulator